MRKIVAGLAAFGAVFGIASVASAQALGEEGTFALSADHLFGITSFNVTAEPDVDGATETEIKGTSTAIGYGTSTRIGYSGVEVPLPASVPRLSFDYFVTESLSIGGGLGYYSFSGEWEQGDADGDLEDVSGFALSPRVGYVLGLSDAIWVWLRGGITYMTVDVEDSVEGNIMQLDAEGSFVFGLAENFGLQFGPHLGFPLGGTMEPEGADFDIDVKVMSFGAYFGLVGWL